jgi:hypothetical protein
MMRAIGFTMVAATLVVSGLVVQAQDRRSDDRSGSRQQHFSASLRPEHEVPAVSSPAEGEFRATLDPAAGALDYELTFSGLQANVVQSHIHIAQPNVNGGIMVWLCGTAAAPGPAGTQTCPQNGTITGTITAANMLAVTTQGIAPGEFDEFIAALRDGLAYANIHSVQSPGGEIRGQVRRGNNGHGDH